ncbi:hypothetical protein [Common midwife toad virus]|uniref:Uncharacterized protein n=2 Tax=Common midwife toad virus TaxID=540070 RepID=A0A2D0XJC0_9VIRU|nr:hypothetical protein D1U33_gp102 [Common midwife toad virus]AIW68593.1 hypothetical protein [common midwife toad virus-NL]ASH97782.1 hypothetical protein [Common midwife toad virus]ASH97830.1 hypothetical protein [Common midwife toad virus]ASH97990.1 hypothetical protein [Common midwife toad virus]ASH98092.1 hypothetical protein [Common midwife toad virus]
MTLRGLDIFTYGGRRL